MESRKKLSLKNLGLYLKPLRICQFFVKEILPAIILSVVFLSCSDLNIIDKEPQKINDDKSISYSSGTYASFTYDPVSFRRVDLYLEKGPAATGYILVAIRSSKYNYRVDSVAIPVSSLSAGASWNTFVFSSNMLNRGEKYKIYVMRSNPHNIASGDYIAWRCSPNNRVDAYPPGESDVNPARISDYAFRTYTEEAIDQQQLSTSSRFFVGNEQRRWQEFVADYPNVNLTSVQLFLGVGPGVPSTDILEVQVRGIRDSNAHDSVIYKVRVPASSLLVGSHWNTFAIQGPLQRGHSFDIHVRRLGVHTPQPGNYIYWYRTTGTQDLYLPGRANYFTNPLIDYTFKTFSTGGLDQQQIHAEDFTEVNNTHVRSQSFTPINQ